MKKYKIKIESFEDIIYLAPFIGREMVTEMAGSHKELLTQVEIPFYMNYFGGGSTRKGYMRLLGDRLPDGWK